MGHITPAVLRLTLPPVGQETGLTRAAMQWITIAQL